MKTKYTDLLELLRKIGSDPNYAEYRFELGELVKMLGSYVMLVSDAKKYATKPIIKVVDVLRDGA